jgi:hypothetical protein
MNGFGRAIVGAAMIAMPDIASRSWIGDSASSPGAKVLARGFGARELALGAGLVWALERREPEHAWVTAAAIADTADAVATLAAWSSLHPVGRWLVLGAAAGSAVQMGALSAATAR